MSDIVVLRHVGIGGSENLRHLSDAFRDACVRLSQSDPPLVGFDHDCCYITPAGRAYLSSLTERTKE